MIESTKSANGESVKMKRKGAEGIASSGTTAATAESLSAFIFTNVRDSGPLTRADLERMWEQMRHV